MTKHGSRRLIAALTCCLCAGALIVGAQQPHPAQMLLQDAIRKQTVERDPKAAIRLYTEIVTKYPDQRAVVAEALLHRGDAEGSLGMLDVAKKTYAEIVNRYPEQKAVVAAATKHLSVRSNAAALTMTDSHVGNFAIRAGVASVSADGTFMVLADASSGDLVRRDLAAGQVKPLLLATGGMQAERPVLSRDMKQVAYTSSRKQKRSFLDLMTAAGVSEQDLENNPALAMTLMAQDQGYELMVAPVEPGSKPRRLQRNQEFNILIPADWAPDGKSILAFGERQDLTWEIVWVSVSDGSVRTVKSIGWRRVGPGRPGLPTLSPDGKSIAYAALASDPGPSGMSGDSPDSHIFVLAADLSSEDVLIKGAINESPVWMPDGRSLLFVSNRGTTFGLWSVPVQGGKGATPATPVQVKRDFGRAVPIGMTSSGTFLYAKPQGRSVPKVLISKLDTGNGSEPGQPVEILGSNPSWSPDGKSIALVRRVSDNVGALIVHDAETGNERLYTPTVTLTALGNPRWFRDGAALLLPMRDPGPISGQTSVPDALRGDADIYRIDLKSQAFKPTGVKGSAFGMPALSADERTVYRIGLQAPPVPDSSAVNPRSLHITAADLNGGAVRPVATIPTTWNPLGVLRFSLLGVGDKELYVMGCSASIDALFRCITSVDLANGDHKQIMAVQEPDSIGGGLLSPDGRAIVIVIRNADTERLIRISVDGTGARTLYGPAEKMASLSWSADGSSILAHQGQRLLRIPTAGGAPEVTQRPIPVTGNVVFSPDGSRIAVATTAPAEPEVWKLDHIASFLKTAR